MKWVVGISLLALAGCQTADVNNAIDKTLPLICNNADSVHAAFILVASTGKISAKQQQKEAQGYIAVRAFCDTPAGTDITGLIARATSAYAAYVLVAKVAE